MIGPINKCVDTLRVRVFTLEEETYKYLMEGNKQIKKKTLWKWIGIGDNSVHS